MLYEDLLIKAMTYNDPEEIPMSAWALPALWMKHPEGMLELALRFPRFFPGVDKDYDYREHIPADYRVGRHTDEWGCVWSNLEDGMVGIVTGHPLPRREDVRALQIPGNKDGHIPHGFLYLRLLDLRGFEEAMADFAEECDELALLINKITEHTCTQVEIQNKTAQRIIYFGDDLGMQHGLAIGPEKWRKYLKPAFARIFNTARKAGKYVYMHTDGMVTDILPDLFEAGVHMVNPQFRANGLDNLVRICKGRYPVHLDLDRQLMPFASPDALKDHVRECVEALYLPSGGFGINIELGPDVPLENAEALLEAASALRTYGK
jgi:hypothetical protein